MGGFYGSTQLRTTDRDRARQVAESVARAKSVKCLIGPALNGWVGLYPENGGQDESFGAAVARAFGGDVLHLLVHDDSVFAYWLWRDGTLADSFYDPPGYFGEEDRASQEQMTGDPETLKPFLAPGKKPQDLADLLRRDGRREAFGVERLQRFAKLLGIANAATSYEYLKEDDHAGVRGWKQFSEVPAADVQREKSAGRERRRRINALKKKLRQTGVLLAEVVKDRAMPRCAAAGDGFALGWHAFYQPETALDLYRPPWGPPQRVELPPGGQVNTMTSDAPGRRLAAALGKGAVVYDVATWQPIADLPERDWAVGVALSSDGALLAHASRQEVVVTRLGDTAHRETRIAAVTGADRQSLAFHPSGRWLVGTSQRAVGVLALDSPAPAWRDLFVGGKSMLAAGVMELVRLKLADVDLDAARRQWQEWVESNVADTRRDFAHLATAELDKKLAEVRVTMEGQFKGWSDMMEVAKAGRWNQSGQGNENPAYVGFSADGQRLWCGSDHGLRVYEWDAVAAATGDAMPPPRFAFSNPSVAGHENYIHAVVEERDGAGIAFAGLAGTVYRMDLSTGEVKELLATPEQEWIFDLKLSADGAALALCTQPSIERRRGRHATRYAWSVWSYSALRAGAASGAT